MKITIQELEYLTETCQNTARARGYADMLEMPLEFRPIMGVRMLTELATGHNIWPSGNFKPAANRFIEAFGAYYDINKQIKYTRIAYQALRTMTR